MNPGSGFLLVLFLFGVSLLVYFLPFIVASSRKKQNTGAIFALNLFLGWSIVGWVVALVWALINDVRPVLPMATYIPPTPPLSPTGIPPQLPNAIDAVRVKEVRSGMSLADVEMVLGVPETRIDLSDKVLWKYSNMTVEFRDGRVIDVC